MSKYLKLLFLAMLVTALCAGSAWAAGSVNVYAGGSDTSDGTKTYLLANEGYASSSTNLSDTTADAHPIVAIAPNSSSPSSLKFCMNNGNYRDPSTNYKYYLAVWKDTTGSSYTADSIIQASELLPVFDSGATTLPISVTTTSDCIDFNAGSSDFLKYDGVGNPANTSLDSIATTDSLVLIHSSGTHSTSSRYNPNFTYANIGFNWKVSGSLSTSDVVSAQVIEGGSTTYSSTFAEFKNQYVAGVNTKADAIVDIASSRVKFKNSQTTDVVSLGIYNRNAGTTTQDPYGDSSSLAGRYLLTQTKNGGAVNNVFFDLEGSNNDITSVKVSSSAITYDSTNSRWRYSGDVDSGEKTVDFTVTVDGTGIIDTRTFTATIMSDATGSYSDITYSSSISAGSWSINAYQAIVPYITSVDGFETWCIVTNTTSGATEVIFDLLGSESGTLSTLVNQSLGSIPSGDTNMVFFDENSIDLLDGTNLTSTVDIAAAGIDNSTNKRYSGKLTVTGDKDSVYMNCIQRDNATGAKRIVPVLTDRGTAGGVKWGN